MPQLQFAIPDALAGKTLNQLQDTNQYNIPGVGRAKFMQNQLNVGFDSPLTKGGLLNYSSDDPTYQGSGEYMTLANLFGNPLGGEQLADRARQQALTARQSAIAPAVSSLEASIPEQAQKFGAEKTRLEGEVNPIKQRYQLVLDELKRRETKQVGEAQTALSREYGKRGIALSSGAFDQNLAQNINPLTDFYGIQGREAAGAQEESLRNITNLVNQLVPQETEANRTIRNAIAQLQAGAGNASIDDAFNQLKFMEEQRQYNQNFTLKQSEQEMEKRLKEAQIANYNQPAKNDPYSHLVTLGEGDSVFNRQTLQNIFKNPKTYQANTNNGDNGWSK